MKHHHICPKCRSNDIIGNVHPVDRGHANQQHTAQLATYRDPEAFLFKGRQSTTLSAYVCGECGYVEFYAEEPRALNVQRG
jgi:predicted nucleic-acid-binding Zn-ribbon protein